MAELLEVTGLEVAVEKVSTEITGMWVNELLCAKTACLYVSFYVVSRMLMMHYKYGREVVTRLIHITLLQPGQ